MMPLDIFVQGEALKSLIRIKEYVDEKWDGLGSGKSKGHRRWLRDLSKEVQIEEYYIVDRLTPRLKWDKKYKIDIGSFSSGKAQAYPGVLTCFTDGSKMDDKVGAAFVIKLDDETVSKSSYYLGKLSTVFQAEITGITAVCMELLQSEIGNREVMIFCDSQAALLALANPEIKSNVVLECANQLDILGERTSVTLSWIKAHVGTEGNEEADSLAKEGGARCEEGPEPFLPVPQTVLNSKMREFFERLWNTRWNALDTCRQTKHWFPKVDRARSIALFRKTNRKEYGNVIQLISGHNFLRRHEALVHPGQDSSCRLCGEKEETVFHLVIECPRVRTFRINSFGSNCVNVFDTNSELVRADVNSDVTNTNLRNNFSIEWSPEGVLKFARTIEHLLEDYS